VNFSFTPAGGYTSLASAPSPAEVVYLAEAKGNSRSDHFHPSYWTKRRGASFVIDPLTELQVERHGGGAIYVFLDGHAKWHRFSQLWNPGTTPPLDAFNPGAAPAALPGTHG
jgi:prepilin-type processing-associated H-X9-DG protein